jgi:uncharacterized protein YjbJ (UPF0337 family)
MNADQLKGKWKQFKGELKQQWGKFTDNDLQQIEGSYDKIICMLQERYGGNCVSLVRERYGEKKDVGGPVAAAVSAGSHEGKDVQRGNHQEDMDYRVRSHFT